VALRALGLVFAKNQRFELVLALVADVLEDRHEILPITAPVIHRL
jgi:hypothetical protein